MDLIKKKRVTIKSRCPNPLFEKWLTEWRDKAYESESKMQYAFSTALKSLKKYPLPLETGKDCKILHGFGEKLCSMLDEKLAKHQSENNLNMDQLPVSNPDVPKKPSKRKASSPRRFSNKERGTRDVANSPEKCNMREYIPKHRSGAYAILLTLYEKSVDTSISSKCMTKAEIISKGQSFCDTSFTKSGPDTRYTGWSSMSNLIEKKLVYKEGNPAKFSLTNEGLAIGDKLYIQHKIEEFQREEETPICSTTSTNSEKNIRDPSASNDLIGRHTSVASSSSSSFESVILAPHSFEIVLLIDTQEVSGTKGNLDNEPVVQELKRLNVKHEIRNLKVGDYVWICQDISSSTELVLPYIIERKRMDDLGQSIKDDRFHEQKFRLKQCGIKNLIYLVESHGKNEHVGLPFNTLLQAATNTLVQDGFNVKFTANIKESCQYLACLSKLLISMFKDKTLVSCPKEDIHGALNEDDLISLMNFIEFNKSSSKTRHFKVREMFIRQLLQIKGMSVDKAIAIAEKYPTPNFLRVAYKGIIETEGEKLLAGIQYGTLKKNVGQVLSKIVYQLFCKNIY